MGNLWMYYDLRTGRMIALGTKEQIENVAKKDAQRILDYQKLVQETKSIFPKVSA